MKPLGTLSLPTRVVLLTAVYFLGGILGHFGSFMSGKVALVWPPAGIALAAILLFGYRFWPGVAAGAALFTFVNGAPLGFFTIATAIGNTAGAVVCAFLLERLVEFRPSMERVRDVAGFLGFACLLGTTVNALFNVVGLCYAGMLPWDALFTNTVEWWVPNAMGSLVIAPVILAWAVPSSIRWSPSLAVEAVFCAAGLLIGTGISFNSWFVYGIENYPLAYLPYPFLIWGALRFGQRGATTGTLVVSAMAIYELLQRRGPFVADTENTSLMLVGCYIGIVAITNMLLASAAVERSIALRLTEESEKRYRAVVEDQTDLICRFSPDGTLTFVNDAFCRFHGRQRRELIGTNFFSSLGVDDREIPLSYLSSVTPSDPARSFDNRVLLPGGIFVWQQCTVRALIDSKDRITEFQAVIQDITRRKQSEEAARIEEQRVHAILNSMVDGVIVIDRAGYVSSFNPAAERIFCRSAADVYGHPIKNLFIASDQKSYEEYLVRNARDGRSKIIELTALRPDGSTLPIDFAMSQVVLANAPLSIAVVRDISERKKMEDHLRQSQKMEAIGRLAGGVAHDFNNLMQAILGYCNLLLGQRLASVDPNREAVEQIQKSADRATSLARQLLAFSRKQVLEPRLLSLNNVVADMNKLLRRLIGENICLEMKLGTPPPCVRADRGQLEQVILNLSINARDAMPQGGTLCIESRCVELSEEEGSLYNGLPKGSYAVLSVSDTGCGISPEVKVHLFEPFFTTKEMGKGTGLGLSIVYGIVKQSGGEIVVQSEPGRGATFEIYLPRFAIENAEHETVFVPRPKVKGEETILLVEDEELVRMMLVETLKAEGYVVLAARHGAEALAMAARHEGQIHLLVTDLSMPELSGWELASRLAETHRTLPVLYMSGYSDAEAAQDGRLEGSPFFLQKPFRPDVLLVKMRQILDANKST